MTDRAILGMLTPSPNTVLEPVTTALLRGLPDVSVHFARLRVTEISLSEYGLNQFEHDRFLAAAELLADARCQVIAWNGTSAGWRGFDHDDELCRLIAERTGAAATSSILATIELFRRHGNLRVARRFEPEVHQAVVLHLTHDGYDFGGANGSTHILMRPSQYKRGGRISYALANRSYEGRIMGSYSI